MLNSEQLDALRREPAAGPNRVAAAKEMLGLTQVQLASAIGVTQSLVSKVERGELPKLPVETARKFSEFFGCAIEDLFPRSDDRQVVNS